MRLASYNTAILRHPEWGQGLVESASTACIYFLYWGRNAWHSTWVQHYSEGSVATTPADLVQHAEQRRGNGNVYFVRDLPALVFRTERCLLLVTEINTSVPLSGYKRAVPGFLRLVDKHGQEVRRLRSLVTRLKRGARVSDLAASFAPASPFWSRPKDVAGSVLYFLAPPDTSLKALEERFIQRESRAPRDRRHSVCWTEKMLRLDPSSLLGIAAEFDGGAMVHGGPRRASD